MRILISAIACNPNQGSESGIGWKAIQTISKHHQLHVLTLADNQKDIERALAQMDSAPAQFTFFGNNKPYHENRLIARLQSWLRYRDWIKQSLAHAQRLHKQHAFELAHHVTYASWRIPSPLWQLDCPFIWGPIGGVAEYPRHLLGKLSKRSAAFEIFRNISNGIAARSASMRQCIRHSKAIVASNRETFEKLASLRGNTQGLHTLFPMFFSEEQIAAFRFDTAHKPAPNPLRLFAGGNLIGSKGIIFALEAVKIATARGVPCHFLLASNGPEVPFLKHKVKELQIESSVEFHEGFHGAAYADKLKESHVFLLPSFRENAPGTILEAMLAGCVPVVVAASAQGEIVNSERGIAVPVGDPTSISAGLAEGIISLFRDQDLREQLGQNASRFAATGFTAEHYAAGIDEIYRSTHSLA